MDIFAARLIDRFRLCLALPALLLMSVFSFAAPPLPIVPAAPDVFVLHGVSMVPLTPLASLLKLTVTEGKEGDLHITREAKSFTCTLGLTLAKGGVTAIPLSEAPLRVNDEIYLPLEPLIAALGGSVKSIPPTQLLLTFPDLPELPPLTECLVPEGQTIPGNLCMIFLLDLSTHSLLRLTYNGLNTTEFTESPDGRHLLLSLWPRSLDIPSFLPEVEAFQHAAMAPLEGIASLLKADVRHDPGGALTISYHGKHVTFTAGQATAVCDGQPVDLTLAPFRSSGMLYVPLHRLARLLGWTVSYDEEKGNATIAPDISEFFALPLRHIYAPRVPLSDEEPGLGTPKDFRDNGRRLALLHFGDSACRQLSFDAGDNANPSASLVGRYIVFTRDGNIILHETQYEVGYDGFSRLLSADPADVLSYTDTTFSPDGQEVAFTEKQVAAAGPPLTRIGIVKNVYPHTVRMLASGCEPHYSPDGATLAYCARGLDGTPAVCLINADGTHPRVIGVGEHPCFSPDGSLLLYTAISNGRHHPVLYRLSGTGTGTLTASPRDIPTHDDRDGVFSPDGACIVTLAYAAGAPESATPHGIRLCRLSDGTTHNVLLGDNLRHPSFTPDGHSILYLKLGDLYRMGFDGGNQCRLTRDAHIEEYRWAEKDMTLLLVTRPADGGTAQ